MKTVTIGSWDGNEKVVEVGDEATVNDVLRAAGLTITATQSVTNFDTSENLRTEDMVENGQTYFITANHESGM